MKYAVQGIPVPKARPRVGSNGNIYTPGSTKVYEGEIAWAVRARRFSFGKQPVSIRAEFHLPDKRRKDGDNLLKALMDGCEKGGLFDDDKQVVEFTVQLFYGSDNPRTEWEVTPAYEHPHSIYCGSHRSSVEWRDEQWVCSTCGEPTPWMVL